MKKRLKLVLFLFFFLILLFPKISEAHPGNTASDGCHYCRTNCTSWGEVYGARHCHGGGTYNYNYVPSTPAPSCPLMSSYSSLSGQCECYSGYVVQGSSCVSGNTYCRNKYGFNARYSSLGDNCECSYGYVFDTYGTKCISEDEACRNQFGYGVKANYSGKCECKYGYVWEGNKCVYEVTSYDTYDTGGYSTINYSTSTPVPTIAPTPQPTPIPTVKPTKKPTQPPTPTEKPASEPTDEPEVKGEKTEESRTNSLDEKYDPITYVLFVFLLASPFLLITGIYLKWKKSKGGGEK